MTAEDSGSRGSAPLLLQRVIQSAGYHLVVMAAILTNAYISSSVQFLHDGRPVTELYKDIYPIEVSCSGYPALYPLRRYLWLRLTETF